jgi:hypothetical protein
MPGYQTVSQSGAWHPGGAGRLYVNPQQRPGIREGQLSVGRNLLPPVEIRSAANLDNQGVGIIPLIAAAVGLVGAVAVPLIQKKAAAKKAKKAKKKMKAEEARLAKQEAEELAAAQGLVAAPVSGSSLVAGRVGGGINWTPLLIGGGAILAAWFFLGRKS